MTLWTTKPFKTNTVPYQKVLNVFLKNNKKRLLNRPKRSMHLKNTQKDCVFTAMNPRCAWLTVSVAFVSTGEGGRGTAGGKEGDKKTREEQRRCEEEPEKTNRESGWTSWGSKRSLLIFVPFFASLLPYTIPLYSVTFSLLFKHTHRLCDQWCVSLV